MWRLSVAEGGGGAFGALGFTGVFMSQWVLSNL